MPPSSGRVRLSNPRRTRRSIRLAEEVVVVALVFPAVVPIGIRNNAAAQRLAVVELHDTVEAGRDTLVALRVINVEVDDCAAVAAGVELLRVSQRSLVRVDQNGLIVGADGDNVAALALFAEFAAVRAFAVASCSVLLRLVGSFLPLLLAMNFCLASSIAALIFCMVALSLFGIRRVTLYFGVAPS